MRLIQSMIILLLSHTALLYQEGALHHRTSLSQFKKMIICTQPNSWPLLDYANYGCYCGKGGSGTPVDDLDRCCEVHDRCYRDAKRHDNCKPFWDSPYTEVYSYRCAEATLTCQNNNNPCEMFICECDRNAAMCFANSEYNEENKGLPSERCT